MKVSVVIPAYNEEKYIGRCLDSLVAQKTKYEFEVIVVDNNSEDNTNEIVLKYKDKLDLDLIIEKKLGRGSARNTGFKNSKGDIVLSTDADTIVPFNWIERMVGFFDNQDIAAVSGTCKINDCVWYINYFFNIIQPIGMRLYRIFFGSFWLSGFNFGVRKKTYLESGGFDRQLNGLEDIDLSFKIAKLTKIKFISDLPVLFSGRRFKTGFINGINPYFKTFFNYFYFKRNIYFEDIR